VNWASSSLVQTVPKPRIYSGAGSLTTDNGRLQIEVVSELVSLSATPTLDILVYMRAGEDFQLMVPQTPPSYVLTGPVCPSPLDTSVGYVLTGPEDVQQPRKCVLVPRSFDNSRLPLLLFGEQVVSLRTLFKRYVVKYYFDPFASQSANAQINVHTILDTMPMQNDASGYTFTVGTDFIGWYSAGFLACKGGMRFKYEGPLNWDSSSTSEGACGVGASLVAARTYGDTVGTVVTGTVATLALYNTQALGATGVQSWFPDPKNLGMLEVEVPDYSINLFRPAWLPATGTRAVVLETNPTTVVFQHIMKVNATTPFHAVIRVWAAAAEDFSLFCFMGSPIIAY